MAQTFASQGFSRRSFIKGAAALGAAGALVGCSASNDDLEEVEGEIAQSPDEIFSGCCRGNCASGCHLNVHVRDGQVVRTSAFDFPDPSYNRICSKGATHVGRMYGADRVLYPMKRVGERGSNDFERITWDEALDTIAEKWSGYIDEFGESSIMVYYGSGNYSMVSGTSGGNGGINRFMNVLGCTVATLNVDSGSPVGMMRAGGSYNAYCNELTDRINAKTQIIWGCSPAVSMPHTLHYFLEAKEAGTRLIVIDPVYNSNAAKADWWVPVTAGTDGALALSILNVLFENGWIDEDLLRTKTECGLLIKEDGSFLRQSDLGMELTQSEPDPDTGEVTETDTLLMWDEVAGEAVVFSEATSPQLEGISEVEGIAVQTVYENALSYTSQWPPSVAAPFCGLEENDIYELARTYYEEGPVSTEVMMGLNHYQNAPWTTWPVILISMLTDNMGKSGASFGSSQVNAPQFLANLAEGLYPTDSAGNPCSGTAMQIATINMGEVFETGTFQGNDVTLKSIYVHGSNPIVTMADYDYTTNWFDQFEFSVVADICMTETCKHADIVLPSAHWFEVEDIGWTNATHPYISWQEKCVEPLGESKPDWDIWGLLVEKMGKGDFWNLSSEEFMEVMLSSEYMTGLGITVDRLKEEKDVRILPEGDGVKSAESFSTETGRIRLYTDTYLQTYTPNAGTEIDESKEHGLYWETPKYAGIDREYRETYPYHVLSDHMRTRTHTQWWDCEYVKEYEGDPVVRINPDDAAELGIVEGDTVKLSNDFGYVVMTAVISAGLPRKMVSSPRSYQKDEFIDGHFASLSSYEYNQIVANQCFNDVAVMIEKV